MNLDHLYKYEWYAPHQAWLAEQGLPHHDPRRAKPKRADLNSADLNSANLRSANLRSANLSYANLHSADLRFVTLCSADLRHTNLHCANLHSADLRFASLHSADLRFANLRYVIGNSREIKTIQTDLWPIVLTEDVIAIGCEQHSIEEWRGFDDNRIAKMDDDALEWSRTWRPIIEQIIEMNKAA